MIATKSSHTISYVTVEMMSDIWEIVSVINLIWESVPKMVDNNPTMIWTFA
jgi:hypothetical protein